jgi:hypothetical protein
MFGKFAVSIGAWLVKFATGDVIGKVLDTLKASDDGRAKLEEIHAQTVERIDAEAQQTAQAKVDALQARQMTKLNMPVFWVLMVAMMGPPVLILWAVALYNILWWQHGIWPQGWSIADFPPSIKPWAQAAIDWLFDPLGPPSATGSSLAAAWLARR